MLYKKRNADRENAHFYLVQDARALIIDGHPISGCTIRLRVHVLKPLRQHSHLLQVNVKELLQARSLHLDHNLLPIQRRQMHLHISCTMIAYSEEED